MSPENVSRPAPAAPGDQTKAALANAKAEIERRRKELERQSARRAHKPNLKTIPWKK